MMLEIEGPVPVEKLLEVEVERTAMALSDDTAVGSELTVVHIVDCCASGLIDTDTGVECESKILEELDLCVTCTVDCVTL